MCEPRRFIRNPMARSSGGTSRSSASAFALKRRRVWRRRERSLPDLSRITTTRDTTPASGISHLWINCVVEHRLLLKNENASWRRQNACVPNSETSNPLPICSLTTTLKIPIYFEPLHTTPTHAYIYSTHVTLNLTKGAAAGRVVLVQYGRSDRTLSLWSLCKTSDITQRQRLRTTKQEEQE